GHRPGAPGKTIHAPMEHVLAKEIAIKRMPGPVKDKSAVANPVSVTAYNGAEIMRVRFVSFNAVIAQDQRGVMAGQAQVLNDRAQTDDVGRKTASTDREPANVLTRLRRAEDFAVFHVRLVAAI